MKTRVKIVSFDKDSFENSMNEFLKKEIEDKLKGTVVSIQFSSGMATISAIIVYTIK